MISSHDYSYNNANQRNRAYLADGTYWEYSYDHLGQVTGGVKKYASDNDIPGYTAFAYLRCDRDNTNSTIEVELLGGGLGPQEASYSNLLNLFGFVGNNSVLLWDYLGLTNIWALDGKIPCKNKGQILFKSFKLITKMASQHKYDVTDPVNVLGYYPDGYWGEVVPVLGGAIELAPPITNKKFQQLADRYITVVKRASGNLREVANNLLE